MERLKLIVGLGFLTLFSGVVITNINSNVHYKLSDFSDQLTNTEEIFYTIVQANNGIRGKKYGATVEIYEYKTNELLDTYFPFFSDDQYIVC